MSNEDKIAIVVRACIILVLLTLIAWSYYRADAADRRQSEYQKCITHAAKEHGYHGNAASADAWVLFADDCKQDTKK